MLDRRGLLWGVVVGLFEGEKKCVVRGCGEGEMRVETGKVGNCAECA